MFGQSPIQNDPKHTTPDAMEKGMHIKKKKEWEKKERKKNLLRGKNIRDQ